VGFFIWLERTDLSVWIRETPSLLGFPFILYLHTLGLALLAGVATAMALWLLTFADRYPTAPLRRLFPIMWLGFGINAVSGVLLLIAYPAKALTNPVFYIKLVAVFAAVVILQWLDRVFAAPAASQAQPMSSAVKLSAGTLLALWCTATVTGRLLAYTHSILMASDAF
jgi:hypothetical protein